MLSGGNVSEVTYDNEEMQVNVNVPKIDKNKPVNVPLWAVGAAIVLGVIVALFTSGFGFIVAVVLAGFNVFMATKLLREKAILLKGHFAADNEDAIFNELSGKLPIPLWYLVSLAIGVLFPLVWALFKIAFVVALTVAAVGALAVLVMYLIGRKNAGNSAGTPPTV